MTDAIRARISSRPTSPPNQCLARAGDFITAASPQPIAGPPFRGREPRSVMILRALPERRTAGSSAIPRGSPQPIAIKPTLWRPHRAGWLSPITLMSRAAPPPETARSHAPYHVLPTTSRSSDTGGVLDSLAALNQRSGLTRLAAGGRLMTQEQRSEVRRHTANGVAGMLVAAAAIGCGDEPRASTREADALGTHVLDPVDQRLQRIGRGLRGPTRGRRQRQDQAERQDPHPRTVARAGGSTSGVGTPAGRAAS